jgi:hypothetical protein
MKRSNLALATVISICLTVLFLWWLSARGTASVYILPAGVPTHEGDNRIVQGVGVERGSVSFYQATVDSLDLRRPGPVGWDYLSYADLHSFSEEDFPLPTLKELVAGRFDIGSAPLSTAWQMTFPIWLLMGAFIVALTPPVIFLKRSERRRSWRLPQDNQEAQQDAPSNGG